MALWPVALRAAQTGRTHGRTNLRCRGAQKTLANGEPSVRPKSTRDYSPSAATMMTEREQAIFNKLGFRPVLHFGSA
jgi:hypothetical protein